MSQYYTYNADAIHWLKDRAERSIHAVVTDPPYGVLEYSALEQARLRNGQGIWRLPQAFDGWTRKAVPRFTILSKQQHREIFAFQRDLSSALARVLVPGSHVFIASNTLFSHLVVEGFVASGFELRGQIARLTRTLRGGDRPKNAHEEYPEVSVTPRACWEPWLILRMPLEGKVQDTLRMWGTGSLRRPQRELPFTDVIDSAPARGEERKISPHPSLKPQAFLRQVVRASLPLGKGVLLDPFMGSGSTIAAASQQGIRSIGVEKDPIYFQDAEQAIPRLRALAK